MEIISRAEAKARGLTTFFTGEPCIHGHVDQRSVLKGIECAECRRIRQRKSSAEKIMGIDGKLKRVQYVQKEKNLHFLFVTDKDEFEKAMGKNRKYDNARYKNPEIKEQRKRYNKERYLKIKQSPGLLAKHREQKRIQAARKRLRKKNAEQPIT